MINVAVFTDTNLLKLPDEITGEFNISDRFVVWKSNDTLHLKRINSVSVTDIIANSPYGEELSLNEINDIVHKSRSERKKD